ncbi:MAG: cell division protein FtsA [Gammaproteobacteria bacterium]|nr:MAG: cell division protein FtsA [Gammaproteobacteria bacterium]
MHILRQRFTVDRQTEIDNPIGLMGENLTIQVHVISAAKTAYYNLLQAFAHCDIDVDSVVASGFSSAIAVTTAEEKQLGICVLDIGAGTTDITVIHHGVVKHTEVIPLGGELITSDIAFFLRTTQENAEKVKHDISVSTYYNPQEMIEMPGVSQVTRQFSKHDIANVVSDRCHELLDIVEQKLNRAGVEESFPGGYVICGGTADLQGLVELVMEKTRLPVRRAVIEVPLQDGVKKGSHYATIMGLFMCAYEEDYTRVMTDDTKKGIIPKLGRFLGNTLRELRKQF